jgi:hypothetical protein
MYPHYFPTAFKAMRVLNLLALCMAACPLALSNVIKPRDNGIQVPVTKAPPSDVILVYPDADVYPLLPIQLGVKLDIQQAGGMKISQQITLVHPNKTAQVLEQGKGIELHSRYFYSQDRQCTTPSLLFEENATPMDSPRIAQSVYCFSVNNTGTYV